MEGRLQPQQIADVAGYDGWYTNETKYFKNFLNPFLKLRLTSLLEWPGLLAGNTG